MIFPMMITSFDVHYTWQNSVGPSVKSDKYPTGGLNDCAVDVCIVLGRLMKVGLSNCDQLPLAAAAALPDLTKSYRMVIARKWHTLTRDQLNETRTALADDIRDASGPNDAEL